MDRRLFAASALAAAIAMAGPALITSASAGMMTKAQMMKVQHENMARAKEFHLVRCYGVSAIGRNDCAAGAHSCAGQATLSRDPASFVLLPAGDCQKLAGSSFGPGGSG